MIERHVTQSILNALQERTAEQKVTVIRGHRQVGKSMQLKKIEQALKKAYRLSYYVSVQDLSAERLASSDSLVNYLESAHDYTGQPCFLLIDDIHMVPQSDALLESLIKDQPAPFHIIATAGPDYTIQNDFVASIAHIEDLNRMTFKEFFQTKTGRTIKDGIALDDLYRLKTSYIAYKSDINRYLYEYIKFGGYPEVIVKSTYEKKMAALKGVWKVVCRTIKQQIGHNQDGIAVLKGLSHYSGWELTLDQLAAHHGKDSKDIATDVEQLSALDLIYTLPAVDPSKGRERIYLADFGLLNYINGTIGAFKNDAIEWDRTKQFVAIELYRKYKSGLVYSGSDERYDFILTGAQPAVIRFFYTLSYNPDEDLFQGAEVSPAVKVVLTQNYLDQVGDVHYIPVGLFPFFAL